MSRYNDRHESNDRSNDRRDSYNRDSGRDSNRDSGRDRRDTNIECKVYVGDLPRDASENDVERAFKYYGPLKSVWVARNPPGFAFVEFEDARDADDAVRGMDGRALNNTFTDSRIRVENSTGKVRPKPWMQRRGPPRSRRGFNPDDKCYECGERGHYAYDCKNRSYRRSRSRERSRGRGGGRSRSRSRSGSRGSPPRRSSRRSRSNSRSRDRGSPARGGSPHDD